MIYKKLLAIILSVVLVLTTFSGMVFSVSAVETEERDVHYSDLFFGYSYYLENSPLLKQYYEGAMGTFTTLHTDFYNDGEYKWSYCKELIDTAASPVQILKNISDAAGLTNYTYNNALDSANLIFARHLVGGYAGNEFVPAVHKYLSGFNDFAKLAADEAHELTELEKAANTTPSDILNYLMAKLKESGLIGAIPADELEAVNSEMLDKLDGFLAGAKAFTTVLDALLTYSASLVFENVRLEVVWDVYNTAPNGTILKDGTFRLRKELLDNFSKYFIDNYIGRKLLCDFIDWGIEKLFDNTDISGNLGFATGILKVTSFVTFEILRPQTVDIDDLMTQIVLKNYCDGLYDVLQQKAAEFSKTYALNNMSVISTSYIDALNALVCAVDAAIDASEKIKLSYNEAKLEVLKDNFYEKNMAAIILNQAVDTVKLTPKEELVKYSYGDWVITIGSYILRDGTDKIDKFVIYTPWDGLDANIIVPVDTTITVPENTFPVINGYLKCSKNRYRSGAYVYNYGDLTINGFFAAQSSRANSYAGFVNYNKVRIAENLGVGYNGTFTGEEGSVTYVGGDMNQCTLHNTAVLYLEGNYVRPDDIYYSRTVNGTIYLCGTKKQTIGKLGLYNVVILNDSAEGVSLENVTVSNYFNHNGKVFTTTNCTFPDYDGDGVNDNLDTLPMVGNPCVITVYNFNPEYGSVSTDRIETVGGTVHTVIATPAEKYEFLFWKSTKKTESYSPVYTFVAKTDEIIAPYFEKRSQPITTSCSGGSIKVVSRAEIESTVNVSVIENEGYVYTEGSLCYNGNKILNGSFIMPDEPVTLTAEFVRNENYFALKEKIAEAKAYTYENYSATTFADLQNAIDNAESVLTNGVTAETANEYILSLQNAEAKLTDKFITKIAATNIPKLYLGVEELIYNTVITVYYDNGTTETTTAFTVNNFDCWVLGEQTVTFNYGIASCTANVTVIKRDVSHIEAEDIPDQIYVNDNTYFEPEISITYPLTGEELILGTDYTLTYSNNSKIGTATVKIIGKGKYGGETDLSFTVYCDHSGGFSADGICTECACYQEPATDSQGYYLISNAGNLFWFAEKVNSGTGGINGRLINDLNVTKFDFVKIGTSTKKYWGTFDGGRHTLTYNITGSDHCAPFAYVSGATIKNLNVAGVINASGRNAASIVAEVPQAERLTLENCFSSVTINSTLSGDGTHGGLIGAVMFYGNVTITNSAFVGAIYGTETAYCGGIVGWSNAITLNITNTFVAAEFSTIFDDCNTFVRNAGALTLTNCYYLNEYNASPSAATQMTAEQFANGEVRDLLNNGTTVWGQKIGVTPYPIICNHPSYANGVCELCGKYGTPPINNGYYEISIPEHLFGFAELVNSGNNTVNGRLLNDLDISEFNFIKIGTSEYPFKGTFDGNGHTLTFVINDTTYAAPFARAAGCTIKNLHTKGTINASDKFAGGIIGDVVSDTAVVENCISGVQINSTLSGDGTHGGLIGVATSAANIKNCGFYGSINGIGTNSCGGIMGWSNGASTITNSYVAAEFNISATNGNTFARNNVSMNNCYYLTALNSTPSGATQMTAEQFANGEVRDLLNNGTTVWGQKIGVNPYPIICTHSDFLNGFCNICGSYEEPALNSSGFYFIENAGQLFWFAKEVNSGNNTIKARLIADIDLEKRLWTPIGVHDDFNSAVASINFKGIFNGNFHVIRNLVVNETSSKEAGFFGRTNGASIYNLGIENASVTQSNENKVRAGILGGEIYNSSVTNCYAQGTVSTLHPTDCGGIAGEAAGTTTITNCYTSFSALTDGSGKITNCYDATTTTPEQFASGEMVAALNNGGNVWMQVIGVNKYPVFSKADSETNACGDLNGDSLINSSDLIALKQYLIFNNGSYNMDYDINRDKYIDLRDLVRIKRILTGL